MADLASLPAELLIMIIANLDGYYRCIDLCALSQTNHRLYAIVFEDLDRHLRHVFSPGTKQGLESHILQWSAENGKEESVKRLLKAGIHIRDHSEWDTFNFEPITLAARNGHVNIVKAFIDYGVDFHQPGIKQGWYGKGMPLPAAIIGGHEAVVRLLIDHGASLKSGTHRTFPVEPLSIATKMRNGSLVKLLLDHGCDPHTFDAETDKDFPTSAWTNAATSNLEILELFIARGIEPKFNGPDSDNWYLMEALKRDQIELVKFLYDHGPRLKTCPEDHWLFDSPQYLYVYLVEVSYALTRHPQELAFLLGALDLGSIISEYSSRQALMDVATELGNKDMMELILDADWASKYSKNELRNCLFSATTHGQTGMVKMLLDYGALPGPEETGRFIFTAIRAESYEILKLMLDLEANSGSDCGYFLEIALGSFINGSSTSKKALIPIIRLLVENFEPGTVIPTGKSFNMDVAQSLGESAEVLEILLKPVLGGSLLLEDPFHETIFVVAIRSCEIGILEQCLKAGFDPNSDVKSEFLASSSSIPLILAATATDLQGRNELAVDLLLKYGARIERQDFPKELSQFYIIYENRTQFSFTAEHLAKATQLLLEKGANPFTTCSKNGELIPMKETMHGPAIVVKVFLEHFLKCNRPLSEIKSLVEEATGDTPDNDPGIAHSDRGKRADFLWRWYWQKVYPCPPK